MGSTYHGWLKLFVCGRVSRKDIECLATPTIVSVVATRQKMSIPFFIRSLPKKNSRRPEPQVPDLDAIFIHFQSAGGFTRGKSTGLELNCKLIKGAQHFSKNQDFGMLSSLLTKRKF